MAGLSITRRRKAWLKGVVYGATGRGKCLLQLPKLRDIFQRGMLFGRMNPETPYVRAVVEQEQRRRQPQRQQQLPRRAQGRPRHGEGRRW